MDNSSLIARLWRLFGETETWSEQDVFTQAFAIQASVIAAAALIAAAVHYLLRHRTASYISDTNTITAARRLQGAGAGMIGILVFLVLVFVSTAVIRDNYPKAGSSLLTVAISLSSAWAIIRLTTSLIANRGLARLIAVTAWAIAALDIVGFLQPMIAALESVGLFLGATRITLWAVLKGLLLLAVLIWAALFVTALVMQRLQDSTVMTPRTQVLVGKIAKFSLITLAAVVALSSMGVNLAALAVFTGALGVGIGIGLQHQVSNLLSGLFLLLDKSIKPGDVIEVGDTYGSVREMSARYVGVVTRDNKELLIPNDTFVLNQVVNWSHNDRSLRLDVVFGVSYGANPHQVRTLAAAAAQTSKRVARQPAAVCHLTGFGESSLDFILRFWISDPENGVTNVKGEVLLALWDTFKEHGIEIPYPHRHVILANQMPTPPRDIS